MTTVKELKRVLESLNDALIVKVLINGELVDLAGISIKKSSDPNDITLYASINPFQENTEEDN